MAETLIIVETKPKLIQDQKIEIDVKAQVIDLNNEMDVLVQILQTNLGKLSSQRFHFLGSNIIKFI